MENQCKLTYIELKNALSAVYSLVYDRDIEGYPTQYKSRIMNLMHLMDALKKDGVFYN